MRSCAAGLSAPARDVRTVAEAQAGSPAARTGMQSCGRPGVTSHSRLIEPASPARRPAARPTGPFLMHGVVEVPVALRLWRPRCRPSRSWGTCRAVARGLGRRRQPAGILPFAHVRQSGPPLPLASWHGLLTRLNVGTCWMLSKRRRSGRPRRDRSHTTELARVRIKPVIDRDRHVTSKTTRLQLTHRQGDALRALAAWVAGAEVDGVLHVHGRPPQDLAAHCAGRQVNRANVDDHGSAHDPVADRALKRPARSRRPRTSRACPTGPAAQPIRPYAGSARRCQLCRSRRTAVRRSAAPAGLERPWG
jgi:hypothetical protein